jgi:threonine/homoserine/homoserine lactone efflux protein
VVAQFLREAAMICVVGSLLGVVFGAALAYGIAALAGRFGQRLRESARAQQTLNRAAALVFAGLALRLVLAGT